MGGYLLPFRERLEFTFAWETPNHEDGPGVQTHVIVRFEKLVNGGTGMHFSQTGFLSVKSAISHTFGWNGTFDRLAEVLLEKITRQALELPPTETRTQISSLSDGSRPWAKCV